jgi:hypothetical protein
MQIGERGTRGLRSVYRLEKRPSCVVGFGGGFRRQYCTGGEDMVDGAVVEAWVEGKEEKKKNAVYARANLDCQK